MKDTREYIEKLKEAEERLSKLGEIEKIAKAAEKMKDEDGDVTRLMIIGIANRLKVLGELGAGAWYRVYNVITAMEKDEKEFEAIRKAVEEKNEQKEGAN